MHIPDLSFTDVGLIIGLSVMFCFLTFILKAMEIAWCLCFPCRFTYRMCSVGDDGQGIVGKRYIIV